MSVVLATRWRYLPPQQPRQVNKGALKESYLRLTMHAEDGTLTVVARMRLKAPSTSLTRP